KGRTTYDSAADVKHIVANHLISLFQKHGLGQGPVLEIGVGSGYFTSLYAKKFPPNSLTLWDIAGASELPYEVVQADAESALPAVNQTFSAVVSASTMQWFNSPAAFLIQLGRVLKPSGLAVLSTFGPDTFCELSAAGVIGLPYYSEQSLHRIIPSGLELLELHTGLITKVFNEPIDVFRHLRATGVNARRSDRTLNEIIKAYPRRADGRCSLTYQPIYLILRKI
ncbi:MAG: methyltransferase domain-containing protein, partial [Muribaculaceae bacterium]|nr:methyltransferase domain-containing protein [Muribaculaceae bacterium]